MGGGLPFKSNFLKKALMDRNLEKHHRYIFQMSSKANHIVSGNDQTTE